MRILRLKINEKFGSSNSPFSAKENPLVGGDSLSPVVHRHPNLNLMKKTLVRLMHNKCIPFFEIKKFGDLIMKIVNYFL